jgi:hypothetical protein
MARLSHASTADHGKKRNQEVAHAGLLGANYYSIPRWNPFLQAITAADKLAAATILHISTTFVERAV